MDAVEAVGLEEFFQTSNNAILMAAVAGRLDEFLAQGHYVVLLFLSKHRCILLSMDENKL